MEKGKYRIFASVSVKINLHCQFTNKAYKRTILTSDNVSHKSPQIILVQLRENQKFKYAFTFDVIG